MGYGVPSLAPLASTCAHVSLAKYHYMSYGIIWASILSHYIPLWHHIWLRGGTRDHVAILYGLWSTILSTISSTCAHVSLAKYHYMSYGILWASILSHYVPLWHHIWSGEAYHTTTNGM